VALQDLAEYPEHRVGFFKFMRAVNQNCFPALLKLDGDQFKLTMDAFVWGLKHTMRDIADTGLTILLELINNFASAGDPAIANAFFQQYFLSMLQDLFFVLTDSEHKSGFKNQSILLARLFDLVESGQIQAPLFDPAQVSEPNMTNQQFIRGYVANMLSNAFPHMQASQIQTFVTGLCELNQDPIKFKLNLRDFLIQLKEFSGENTDAIYAQEAAEEKEKKEKEEREKNLHIPGMIKPSELPPNEDEEL
jgi:exportin-1